MFVNTRIWIEDTFAFAIGLHTTRVWLLFFFITKRFSVNESDTFFSQPVCEQKNVYVTRDVSRRYRSSRWQRARELELLQSGTCRRVPVDTPAIRSKLWRKVVAQKRTNRRLVIGTQVHRLSKELWKRERKNKIKNTWNGVHKDPRHRCSGVPLKVSSTHLFRSQLEWNFAGDPYILYCKNWW
jgi:hypothetical protein